jgi:acyl-CoA dehydrogenase
MNPGEALRVLREHGPGREAESSALGAWLLAGCGLERHGGLVTVAPGTARDSVVRRGSQLTGSVHRVPWARHADRIALLVDGAVCAVAATEVSVEPGLNIGGEQRDTVVLSGVSAEIGSDGLDADRLWRRGALTRVMLMAGGLERICAMSIAYAEERAQFGRPIGSFQAVQAHLVAIAQHAALVGVAAEAAASCGGAFETAAAKLLANRAAIAAARAAHQVHGARGTTLDHPLSAETRRLWAWRSEYGDERHWSVRLGAAAAGAGADRLYPAITSGSNELEL